MPSHVLPRITFFPFQVTMVTKGEHKMSAKHRRRSVEPTDERERLVQIVDRTERDSQG